MSPVFAEGVIAVSVDKTNLVAVAPLKVPALIKRNTILLAFSQAFMGSGTQNVATLGALIAVQLSGSAAFAGLATSLTGAARFFIAYPLGRIMDTYGRRAGLLLGLGLGFLGALLTGVAVMLGSFPLFGLAMLTFGMGMAASHQLRLAAADMYPPARRAEGLGYVLTGALVGALGGPVIISISGVLGPQLGMDRLAVPWLLIPVVILSGIGLVTRIHPDPRDIAAHLEDYYPGYVPETSRAPQGDGKVSFWGLMQYYPRLTAFICSFAAQGNMVMIMAMTSFVLDHYGHPLPMISLSVAIHVVGMYAFALPLGRLSDRLGRRPVLMLGIFIAASGSLLVGPTPNYVLITFGTFIVGVGWSAITVAGTAVIADTTPPSQRGRAIGTNDTFANFPGVILPIIAGPMAQAFGMMSIGLLGAAVFVVPMLMVLRMTEPGRGKRA